MRGVYTSLLEQRECPEAPWLLEVDVRIVHPDFTFAAPGLALFEASELREVWSGLATSAAPSAPPEGIAGVAVWAASIGPGGGILGWWDGDPETGQVRFVTRSLGWEAR